MIRYVAIHHRAGSFSDRWISYCQTQGIPYRVVNCLDSNIIEQLTSCDYLLWHWSHQDPREQLVARHVITAAEAIGVQVFPSNATCWYYDDKIAQKYLLEAIGAPFVPAYVSYDLPEALRWIDHASWPKVFKLRRGASSSNVQLVRSAQEARALAQRAFSRGFSPVPHYGTNMATRFRSARRKGDLLNTITKAAMRLPQSLATIHTRKNLMGYEKGYMYFQDFIPDNQFDTRVTIIGDRAFAFTRNVRPGDFRASGSGDVVFDGDRINPKCLEIAFAVARRIGSQSMAFDFVSGENQRPLIVEVSYCYCMLVYSCSGYWDANLNWQEGHFWPQDTILVDLLNKGYGSEQYRVIPDTVSSTTLV